MALGKTSVNTPSEKWQQILRSNKTSEQIDTAVARYVLIMCGLDAPVIGGGRAE